MKAPINIGIQAGTKLLKIQREGITRLGRLDYNQIYVDGHWIIWISTNDYINGTYLKLYNDGRIERVTLRENDPAPDVVLIKPRDGD